MKRNNRMIFLKLFIRFLKEHKIYHIFMNYALYLQQNEDYKSDIFNYLYLPEKRNISNKAILNFSKSYILCCFDNDECNKDLNIEIDWNVLSEQWSIMCDFEFERLMLK